MGVAGRIARAAAIILLLGSAVLGVWSCRGAFADGSYYLWTLLTTGESFGYPSRAIAQAVMQFPVTAAVHLGVTDLPTILRLQSLGSIGIPAVIWAAALVALRRDRAFWPMAVVAAVAVGTTSFMAVGEYNLAYAMVGASATLLLRHRPVTRTGQAALGGGRRAHPPRRLVDAGAA